MVALNLAILAGLPLLLGIGRLMGGGMIAGVVSLGPVALALLIQIVVANRGHIRIGRFTPVSIVAVLMVGVFLLSVARSNHPGHVGLNRIMLIGFWFAVAAFFYAIFHEASRGGVRRWQAVAKAGLLAPGVVVFANVVLQLAGVQPPQALYNVDSKAAMASMLLGGDVARVLFPMARGINNFGVVAGGALTCSALFAIFASSKSERMVGIVLAGAALLAVILCDSRGALLFSFVSCSAVVAARAIQRPRLLRWLLPTLPVLPLLLLFVLQFLATTDVAALLSRRAGDLDSATGRTLFWAAGVAELLSPSFQQVLGYGQYGQAGSGVSAAWANLFQSYVAAGELQSLHNLTLQAIFDLGYLGVGVMFVGLWVMISRSGSMIEIGGSTVYIMLGAILYLLFIGTTEASISLFFPENVILLLLVLMGLASLSTFRAVAPGPGETARHL